MWKSTKQDERPGQPNTSANAAVPVVNLSEPKKEFRPMDAIKPADNFRADVAHIGKSVLIRGELSGSEDLYLDGEVEGSIDLHEHTLTIGPHGRVRANVQARDITVFGRVDGNINGKDRVELKRSAVVAGDVMTQRVVIEDGAYFKGSIDIKKDAPKQQPVKAEVPKTMVAAASSDSALTTQPSLLTETKY
jgi:cytoskeletal protein CcmA (bactofilin family)